MDEATPSSPSVADQATEVLYTLVGAGVVGAQRLMVARRDLDLDRRARDGLNQLCRAVDEGIDTVERTLPEPAGTAMRRSRDTVRDVGRFLWVASGLAIATDRPEPTRS